ncbi:MAG: ATP-binding cassette domain-containing protein [Nannocystis sp.]|uniref:ATP-binding cassette domain-containing protein n=1 Tax=Nannocystis sp. TaxID=1962667 RepID=UPI0024288909|nr:ATP-binding cassette domain-containing protein [Nannocystis sp.]MBK9755903.1 ATP-binding cassette domain-containing protein [Nannocystis sp.]
MTSQRRLRLAVEVIQSSAMDCGPAALKCLLAGHGVEVSYGRLREACQTDVDGTSIDTLEEVAVALGLEAEQCLIPVDHLFLRSAEALPALAVVLSPGGLAHFVVLWSRVAGRVQVMDPAIGRRFVRAEELARRLFVHRMPVPAGDVRGWLGSLEFTAPLRQRGRALGIAGGRMHGWIAAASADPEILGLAGLDAAIRLAASLVDAGALRRGGEATRLVDQLIRETAGLCGPELYAHIPEAFFTAVPGPEPDTALLRGAVIVRVRGVRADAPSLRPGGAAGLSPDLALALSQPAISPLSQLFALLRADGLAAPLLLAIGLIAAAAGVVVEALVLRAMVELGVRLGVGEQRLAAAAAIAALFVVLAALELPIAVLVRRLGRRLSARLRVAFLTQIPRLGDRYLASRPISDMAERCHRGHVLRGLPDVAARLFRGGCELVFTAAALIWIDPGGAPWIVLAALTVVGLPLALLPLLGERTLKVQSHAGALGRFYFDALLGLVAIRTHAAERSLLREHEDLLVEWSHAQRGLVRVQVVVVGLTALVGLGLAAGLFDAYVSRHAEPAGALLLLYWSLSLPAIGERIAEAAFELPALRVTALRLLEPLTAAPAAAVEPAMSEALAGAAAGGVALSLREVGVVAGGNPILHTVDLEVAAGQHIAIVGASGAGKSTLLGLLLGWHRASGGEVRVDGRTLDEATLVGLRQVTAWVDPAVQLWNESLLDNLEYGNREAHARLPETLVCADLGEVLERLPGGLQCVLGENGGLVSGGEGQRVRLGRALQRERPRLVLLDEPLRGLDRDTRARLLARVRERWRGSTLLCVTHDIAAAAGFDRVLVVAEGRIVEDRLCADMSPETAPQFTGLLRAEAELHGEVWSDPRWRRMTIEDGALRVAPGEGSR